MQSRENFAFYFLLLETKMYRQSDRILFYSIMNTPVYASRAELLLKERQAETDAMQEL